MIEQDIITFLKADATLDTLLSSSGSNSKIYPNSVPINMTQPYIIYTTVREGTLM